MKCFENIRLEKLIPVFTIKNHTSQKFKGTSGTKWSIEPDGGTEETAQIQQATMKGNSDTKRALRDANMKVAHEYLEQVPD